MDMRAQEAIRRKSIEVFCSYAPEDEHLYHQLETHLSPLKRSQLISLWNRREVGAGADWKKEIDARLSDASLILLLISPDFMASDYCYGIEMEHALERERMNEARVIPILLRPVDWEYAPFGKFQPLPTNVKPVVSWDKPDEAFLNITQGIRKIIKDLWDQEEPSVLPTPPTQTPPRNQTRVIAPAGNMLNVPVRNSPSQQAVSHMQVVPQARRRISRRTVIIGGITTGVFVASGVVLKYMSSTNSMVNKYTGHTSSVFSVAWSPDGKYIASGSWDRTVRVWEALTGKTIVTYTTDLIRSVAWSPNGKYIASGSTEKTVQVWEALTGKTIATYAEHTDQVCCVAWSPDGKYIASGSEDETVRVWSAP
ncbi:MAG TPA: TIR domain-containing protein [Ktedonobacteraceae bacterium]|nr:TIR domain-containing protein [Ktedonobacteraceae bacterium]